MRVKYLSALVAASVLAGCVPDEPASNAAPTAPSAVVADAGAQSRSDVGALLNAVRAQNGLPALSQNAKLTAAAAAHAQDMARVGFFSHSGSDNSTVGERVRAQGYNYCYVAENIALGQPTAEAVMASWMNSEGHRRNNLSPNGVDYGAARADGNYWVLVFGRSGC